MTDFEYVWGSKLKVLSYSLWGDKPKYLEGAVLNAIDAKTFYPDFETRFYVDRSVGSDYIYKLLQNDTKVIRIDHESTGDWTGLFWRFLPVLETNVDVVICRDTDSRLSQREATSVREWLNSGTSLHVMRDHPGHYMPILGGMCGFRGHALNHLCNSIKPLVRTGFVGEYNSDQIFLAKTMAQFFNNDCFVNDEIFENSPFSQKRNGLSFIGESVDELGTFNYTHRQILQAWLRFKELSPSSTLSRLR